MLSHQNGGNKIGFVCTFCYFYMHFILLCTYTYLHIPLPAHNICLFSYLHKLLSAHTLICTYSYLTYSCWNATLFKKSFDAEFLKYLFRSLWKIFCFFLHFGEIPVYIWTNKLRVKSLWTNIMVVVLWGGSVSRN